MDVRMKVKERVRKIYNGQEASETKYWNEVMGGAEGTEPVEKTGGLSKS